MILDTTTRKLQIVLAEAKATLDCPVLIDYVDITTTTLTPAFYPIKTNGVTTTDILAAPAAATQRKVNNITLFNDDTAAITAEIIYNANGTSYEIVTCTLQVDESLIYTDVQGWYAQDKNGSRKVSQSPAILTGFTNTGLQTNTFNGDQLKVSFDPTVFREGTQSSVASGDMYNLASVLIEKYWSRNFTINAAGNFLGRDATATCALVAYGNDDVIRYYTAVSDTAGVAPTFVLKKSVNIVTGKETLKSLGLDGSSSGSSTLVAPANASSYTVTLPANTGILAAINFAQAWSALQTNSTNGDQWVVSQDAAPFREGTQATTTSGDLYTLTSVLVEKYWTRNVAISSVGNFAGRDATGTCSLVAQCADDVIRYYKAVTGNISVAPTFTLEASFNIITGKQTLKSLGLDGSSSGSSTINAPSAASSYVHTLPTATGTLAELEYAQTWTKPQAATVTALSVSGNVVVVDMSLSNNYSLTLQANTAQTLSSPINVTAGTSGQIAITQNAFASTIAYGNAWVSTDGSVPAVSSTANAVNLLTYYAVDGTHVWFALNKHGVA